MDKYIEHFLEFNISFIFTISILVSCAAFVSMCYINVTYFVLCQAYIQYHLHYSVVYVNIQCLYVVCIWYLDFKSVVDFVYIGCTKITLQTFSTLETIVPCYFCINCYFSHRLHFAIYCLFSRKNAKCFLGAIDVCMSPVNSKCSSNQHSKNENIFKYCVMLECNFVRVCHLTLNTRHNNLENIFPCDFGLNYTCFPSGLVFSEFKS